MAKKQPILNIRNMVGDLLPVLFKGIWNLENNLYQFIICLVKPLSELYDDFVEYEDDTFYEMLHNGQVLSLEHQLNDKYNLTFPIDTNKSIWIEDADISEILYIFNNSEGDAGGLNDEPIYLFNNSESADPLFELNYIYTNEETIADHIDFIANVPLMSGIANSDWIESIITKYKLSGYSFEIKWYTPI